MEGGFQPTRPEAAEATATTTATATATTTTTTTIIPVGGVNAENDTGGENAASLTQNDA